MAFDMAQDRGTITGLVADAKYNSVCESHSDHFADQ